jgi:predicted alpha/beta superfamily hydrolase
LKKVLAGYSMAGLFALYAAYRTGAFDGIVSASGSVWFPDFSAFAQNTPLDPAPKCIYLSLGDAESNSRNQCLQQIESITRSLFEHYHDSGIPSTFELNSGNHFKDYDLRLAKGIAWTLNAMAARR